MKNILIIFLVLGCIECFSQSFGSIIVNVKDKEVQIGNLHINAKTTITEIIKTVGEPDRIEKIAGKDRIYAYDKSGVVFDIGYNENKTIDGITITYNYDGDKKVAKEKFNGTLIIDGYTLSAKSTSQEIQDKTGYNDLKCFSTMCAVESTPKSLGLMLGFTPEKEIGQIAFGLK